MHEYFDIEKAIQATAGYDAYQRIFERWAKRYIDVGTRKYVPFAEFVQRDHQDVYAKARAYARVMGDL